ncbi:MAG: hypothetical protein MUF72_15340 [Elainella sp. Prado103]|nr:hypothetical protein [Elainella sp. Prado103]
MKQTQAEIKAIEAELQSIRAEKSRRSVTLLEPHPGSPPITAPISPQISRSRTIPEHPQADSPPQVSHRTPTHARSSDPKADQKPDRRSESPSIPPAPSQTTPSSSSSSLHKPQRTVECFPLPPIRPPVSSTPWINPDTLEPHAQSRSTGLPLTDRSQMQQLLTAKAQQINALSQQQELMIQELITLSDQFEQALENDSEQEFEPICEYTSTEIPYVDQNHNGTLLLTTRLIDWQMEEPPSMARSRRFRLPFSVIHKLVRSIWQFFLTGLGAVGAIGGLLSALLRTLLQITWRGVRALLRWVGFPWRGRSAARHQADRGSGRRDTSSRIARSQKSDLHSGGVRAIELSETTVSLPAIALHIAGAAVLRVVLDSIITIYPVLWLPGVLIMITPALFAVYRSTLTPHVGFAWGYRLFAIMIGLLLGGRL